METFTYFYIGVLIGMMLGILISAFLRGAHYEDD